MNKRIGVIIFILILVTGCSSTASNKSNEISGHAYTTTDGKGLSITIFAPQMTGLMENQNYLPALIQGELMANFNSYSAIKVFDRVNLEKNYAELLSGFYDDAAEAGGDLGHLAPTDFFMNGNITKTSSGYAFQIQITKTTDKILAASYSGTCTIEELNNFSGIRRVSLDLLTKMGIKLTDASKRALSGPVKADHINAQTSLAQGIIAQQKGTLIEAMAYYYNAVSYDPKLSEANGRLRVLSSNISSGNIGENVRNEIQMRNEWNVILNDCSNYFNKHLPFEIRYNPALNQGQIDFQGGRVALSLPIESRHTDSLKIIDDILSGLNKQGKKQSWGFSGWPVSTLFNDSRPTFDEMSWIGTELRSEDSVGIAWCLLEIECSLINDNNKVLGRAAKRLIIGVGFNATWKTNYWVFNENRLARRLSSRSSGTVIFSNVNPDDITDNISIRIDSVNGIDGDTAIRTGYIRLTPTSEKIRISRNFYDYSWR